MRRIPWRRKWQPNPVFLPGESHAQGSLGVYSPWGCKVLNTTDPHTHAHAHAHAHAHTDTHLPLCSLSLWPALTSPPPAPPPRPPPRPHQFLLGHQPSNPVSALGGLLADPGSCHQCLITESSEPWQPRGKPRPQAPAPWPHRAPLPHGRAWEPATFQVGKPRYGGSRREPAWSPGWGDGGGRPPQAASGSGPCPGLTLAGGNRLRARRFRMKP